MHDKTSRGDARDADPASLDEQSAGNTDKPRHSAKAYAIWLLSKREYSAAALQKKLLARGYEVDETEAALHFLRENNYQSDVRYAGMKARNTAHRAGDWKISMTLAQQGIDEALAKEQIAELPPEEERAAQAARAKFARHVSANGISPELAQKIWRYLGYRGFSGSAIKHALALLKDEAQS